MNNNHDYTRVGITLNDLATLDEDRWYEVTNGDLVEQEMVQVGDIHVVIVMNLYDIIKQFTGVRQMGRVVVDGQTYILAMDGDMVIDARIPDLSYVQDENIPDDFDWERPFLGPPDLAVEIVSSVVGAAYLEERVAAYRMAGTEQIWAIYPDLRKVHVYYRHDPTTIRVYGADEALGAEPLLPGLRIRVSDIFRNNEERWSPRSRNGTH
ncbi:MAG: Uma2 family endonuclease [Chloroflexi bacterium]|nr:Uma2 family endonuclease [Chloroflexota bacterium]